MSEVKNPSIKLKEILDRKDYEDISRLQGLCRETEYTALKLELDYKLGSAGAKNTALNSINEFMYYEEDRLIGYIGICYFGGDALEVNGMVHPEYRRMGIFSKLFSLVRDEWGRRKIHKMLLLSDHSSASGISFIKHAGADYDFSEYEMYLRGEMGQGLNMNNVVLRKAGNSDAKEIARQNSIYFGQACGEEELILPEEEEKRGMFMYIAEVDSTVVGKVNLETSSPANGIYGLGVLPEYRGKGYGRGILSRSIEKLKESNSKDIMLQVVVSNENALNLYKSCGFEVTSQMGYFQMCKK